MGDNQTNGSIWVDTVRQQTTESSTQNEEMGGGTDSHISSGLTDASRGDLQRSNAMDSRFHYGVTNPER